MTIERLLDVPLGMPSPEALRLATEVIRRRYVLPETMQHPQVRSECLRLAYTIQAYGLAVFPALRSGMEVRRNVARTAWPRRTVDWLSDGQATKRCANPSGRPSCEQRQYDLENV
jgi:hypothetical protein